MKKNDDTLKLHEFGFSLVELMVTVGIIGVLASVAVPQYSKFTAKSKQTEAKTSLGAIYTVEKAFFVEQQSYSSCLRGIGYIAEGSQRRYVVGFNAVGGRQVGAFTCQDEAGTAVTGSTAVQNIEYYLPSTQFAAGIVVADITSPYTSITPGGTNVLATFKAAAAGIVADANKKDIWSIDQNQTIKNEKSGI